MSLPRICYFGAYDPAYPRNLILRRGLAAQGARVVICNAPRQLNTRGRMQTLAKQFPDLAGQCDIILLAEFGQSLAPLAWRLARRYQKRLTIDAFTPIYDSAVYDRMIARPRSPLALRYWLIDWLSLRLADRVLTDTAQHRAYFTHAFGLRPGKASVIPVGASQEWFDTPPAPRDDQGVLISFFGSYIPLHGIDTILRTAAELNGREDIRFELIGRGQTYEPMRKLASELDLTNVTFCDPVPPEELPAAVARADICLGIFGLTAKASRVVPNKVYENLALGKPVITADTAAIHEAFTPGEHLLTTPPGDPQALAQTIAALADNPDQRQRLARAGRARMEATFNEAALGRLLLDTIS
jgi:glycosyltransferase involved in cell wall biosynthesis